MKKTFWLACVEIQFVDNEGNTGITRVNATTPTEVDHLTYASLNKLQQGAVQVLYNMLNQAVQILSVVVVSVSNIGVMTEEEFMAGLPQPQAANDTVN